MTETIESLARRFRQLHDIGVALSSERDPNRLLECILLAAKELTRADAGTLYLVTPDKRHLRFAIVRTDSLNIALGGTSGQAIHGLFHDLPMHLDDGSPNHALVVTFAANTGNTVNIPDAYTAVGFDFSGTRKFDQRTGYRSRAFLTVPMKTHDGDLLGVLQLINPSQPSTQEPTEFSSADQHLAESLASQAAVALDNRHLVRQLENLFESFIKLISVAIDEKSPHTSGHCVRVPALTMLLAQAVNETSDGPLSQVHLSEPDLRELRIAAMLHDCGKITTPVHVVDKKTKLETIFDRIHLVETRLALAQREAEAAMWRSVALGELDQPSALAHQQRWCEQMAQDLQFLQACNLGSERMSDADVDRVRTLADRYRWTSPQGELLPLLNADELENLTVRAGTLTAAERSIINRHIGSTIDMLKQLPWPKGLENVPEFAGGHHERMDGKGYPLGLKRDQMSWQARMMGIADIFEALTASDRPYKKAMPLSQALHILANFKANGHIDPDLHDVFVNQKVYLEYAQRFLSPEQIDV